MKQLKETAYDSLSIAVILVVDLLFFFKAILYGEIFFERDTSVFYYPIMSTISSSIQNWTLPLWTPNIFGGFPLFADGEAGLFYPPVAALVYFLPPEQAFIWVTISHFFMAGLFTFVFLRTLGLGRFGSLVGGISFMLGGFTIAQLHHVNLSNSAIWLPLILCFVERSMQSRGARRHVYLLLAGGAFGLQCLAVHVNVPLMSLPVILGYIALRVIFGPIGGGQGSGVRSRGTNIRPRSHVHRPPGPWTPTPGPRPSSPVPSPLTPVPHLELARWYDDLKPFGWRLLVAARVVLGRITLLGWALAIVPLTGLAIAAVQILPLYELGAFSRRAGGLDPLVATSEAQTVYNMITLIFPYFFRDASNLNWGLWTQWETRIYLGILPLILGITAIVLVRSRVVVFFALAGLLAIFIGLADSSPIKLYSLISTLPGYNLVRAPGRYAYIWTFSNAILAAYAANWLSNPVFGRSHFRFLRARWKPRSLLWRLPALVFFVILAIAAMELPIAVQQASSYVASHKPDILNLIQQNYLSLPRMLRSTEFALTSSRVYDGLTYSLSFDNLATRYGLVLVASSVAILLVGYAVSKAKWLWQ
ncbi:MAG: hypothetical protein Q7O66_13685, partial [Dehalococcoidia bacterium]|nr:hypothetical protein [Dehalococcoidia bacterium]